MSALEPCRVLLSSRLRPSDPQVSCPPPGGGRSKCGFEPPRCEHGNWKSNLRNFAPHLETHECLAEMLDMASHRAFGSGTLNPG